MTQKGLIHQLIRYVVIGFFLCGGWPVLLDPDYVVIGGFPGPFRDLTLGYVMEPATATPSPSIPARNSHGKMVY